MPDDDPAAGRPFLFVGLLGLSFKKATARGDKRRGKLTGGRWVTDDDGHHLYIAGGRVVAGRGVQSASGGMHRAKPKPGGGGGGGVAATKPAEVPKPAVKPAATAPTKPEPAKPAPAPKPEPPKPAAAAKPEPKPTSKPEPPKPLGPARDLGTASAKELDAHHKTMSEDWRGGLSDREKHSIGQYTSKLYTEINQYNRTGTVSKGQNKAVFKKMSADIDTALDRSSLKHDTVVYRGVGDIRKLGIDPHNLTGHVLQDPAHLSTSLNRRIAERFAGGSEHGAVLRIRLAKGSKAASAGGLSQSEKEHEVLVHRNTKLRVVGHSRVGGQLVLDLEAHHGD